MNIINICEAKAHFLRLLERVEKGEEVIIARAGKPVAKISAYSLERKLRKPGSLKGKIAIAHDFDELPARFKRRFGGGSR
jgi:prevent-host-death family protein